MKAAWEFLRLEAYPLLRQMARHSAEAAQRIEEHFQELDTRLGVGNKRRLLRTA